MKPRTLSAMTGALLSATFCGLTLVSTGKPSSSEPAGGSSQDVTPAPEPSVERPLIHLEDYTSSVWQVFENRYTGTAPDLVQHGVLFQLGDHYRTDNQKQQGDRYLEFQSLVIKAKRSGVVITITLDRGDFDWINVVAKDAAGTFTSPIAAQDALALGPLGGVLSFPQADWRDLRRRSLRAGFVPLAIMTYWMGPDGFICDTTRVEDEDGHVQHAFWLQDEVLVTIWKFDPEENKLIKAFDCPSVVSISLPPPLPIGDPSHGGLHDPPVGGGTGGG